MKTDHTFFSIRLFVNYRCFAKCGVSDNKLTVSPIAWGAATISLRGMQISAVQKIVSLKKKNWKGLDFCVFGTLP